MVVRITRLAAALAFLLLTGPLAASAQDTTRPARIGIAWNGARDDARIVHNLKLFRQGLADLGHIEGRNLTIESRFAGGDVGRFPELVADLAGVRVDVIVVVGPSGLAAAKVATSIVPIVALDLETDPVAEGFAISLGRPGGNITGIFMDHAELAGKWLQLLREAVPMLRRVAVVWDSSTPSHQMEAIEAASRALGVTLQTLAIRAASDFADAFATASKNRAQAVVILTSPLVAGNASRLAGLAAAKRLPTIAAFRELPRAGCLMAYGPSTDELWRRIGLLTARILKGARPADLPIERPDRFDLVVNLKTAKALGLSIPPSLLLRADQVLSD
jgi:putative ABC transport system substrate-binding protein